jgi:hypothetical protein
MSKLTKAEINAVYKYSLHEPSTGLTLEHITTEDFEDRLMYLLVLANADPRYTDAIGYTMATRDPMHWPRVVLHILYTRLGHELSECTHSEWFLIQELATMVHGSLFPSLPYKPEKHD